MFLAAETDHRPVFSVWLAGVFAFTFIWSLQGTKWCNDETLRGPPTPVHPQDRLTIRRHIFPQTYSQTSPASSGKRCFGAGWALWACAPCRLRWLSRLNRLSSHTERISLIDPLISLLTSSLLTTANPGWHPTIWTSNRGPNGVKNKIKEEKQKTTHTHTYTHFTLISDAHASRLSEILPPVSPGGGSVWSGRVVFGSLTSSASIKNLHKLFCISQIKQDWCLHLHDLHLFLSRFFFFLFFWKRAENQNKPWKRSLQKHFMWTDRERETLLSEQWAAAERSVWWI